MVKKTKYSVQYINEKAPEKIRPKTLLVTSLTAMTVALISTQLVDTLSSVTWVALASFLTAFVSEGYRVFLEFFHRAVKKQMDATLAKSSLELDETGEFHIIEQVNTEIAEAEAEPAYRPITPFGIRARGQRILRSRWAYTFVFTMVGMATVLGSFAVGSVFQDKNYSVTEVNPTEITTKDISSAQQEEIEKTAGALAEQEADQAEIDANQQTETLVDSTREELLLEIATLSSEMEALDSTNDDYEKRIENLEAQLAILNDLVKELTKAQNQQPTNTPTTPTNPSDPAQP